jgi:hypothetical protein
MAFWDSPAVVAGALGFIMLLNPAGNASGSNYRIAHTPAHLQGRAQSAGPFLGTSVIWLAPLLGGVLLERIGGRDAVLVIGALTALAALIPTLSRAIRTVPKPAVWQAELDARDAELLVAA